MPLTAIKIINIIQWLFWLVQYSINKGACQLFPPLTSSHVDNQLFLSIQMLPKRLDVFLMKSSLPYYLFAIVSVIHTVINLGWGLPGIVIFNLLALFPWLDLVIPQDWINPNLKEIKENEDSVYFLIPLYLGLVIDWFMTYRYMSDFFEMPLLNQLIGLILLSMLFASTFLIAHELMHHNDRLSVFIATLHQVKCLYMHFTVAHVYGHHKDVATPSDPSSAEQGMTVYEFIPKSIVGSYKQAMRIKPKEVSFYTLCYILYLGGIYFYFDFARVVISIVAAFGGVSLLETVNYIQHYGLRRKQLPDGSFEKVSIRHSWNAPHRLSNYLLYKLQRHSDHHENSLKPYQTLCSYEESPQLPEGYLGCITLCFFPSVWFDIIDPLVNEYMGSDKALKGTELKSIEASKQKVMDFTKKRLYVFGTIAIVNILLTTGRLVVG